MANGQGEMQVKVENTSGGDGEATVEECWIHRVYLCFVPLVATRRDVGTRQNVADHTEKNTIKDNRFNCFC